MRNMKDATAIVTECKTAVWGLFMACTVAVGAAVRLAFAPRLMHRRIHGYMLTMVTVSV